MEPDPLVALTDDSLPLGRTPRSIRAMTLVVFVALVVALSFALGLQSSTGLAATWNQIWNQVKYPPYSAAQRVQLQRLVSHAAAAYTQQVTVTVGSLRTVQVTATLAWTADISATDVPQEQSRVKALCFAVQRAIWSSALAPSDVLVMVLGPVTDAYGDPATAIHGSAELGATTSGALTWGNLTADSAWSAYDHAYLRPSYIWYVL